MMAGVRGTEDGTVAGSATNFVLLFGSEFLSLEIPSGVGMGNLSLALKPC